MKVVIAVATAALLTCSWAAELAITSLTSGGNLTWTNSVSHATYRVEWAGAATGVWQGFEALIPLTSITVTSTIVTVPVPMFYRVLWLDAPAHAGTYRYSGYEDGGGLVVTGRITLSTEADPITGTWSLQEAGEPAGPIGPQVGEGQLRGTISGGQLSVDLNPGWYDNNVFLSGRLTTNTWTGSWSYSTFGGPAHGGPFTAERVQGPGSP